MPVGKGQIISTTVYDRASRGFDDSGRLSQDVSFSKVDNQFYLEHGLTSKITLVGTTAFQTVDFTSRQGPEDYTGFGATSLGLRYHLKQTDRWVGAVQGRVIIAGAGENISDADLGRGGHGVELRALMGRNFKLAGRDGFADIQSGWIYRPDGPDSLHQDISMGLSLTPNYQILGQAFYTHTGDDLVGPDRILANESLKLQLSLVQKRSERTSYQFGVFRTVAGRNVVQESGIIAGWWRRY